MHYIDFIEQQHKSTKRDYAARVNEAPKAECAAKAKQWGYDFWDGDRKYGYGGYKYDGRWAPIAQKMIEHYGLKSGMKVLDVGCGKAHLLYEMMQAVPGLEVAGIDISEYAITHTLPEIESHLQLGKAQELDKFDFKKQEFDLVISLTTLHNLCIYDLFKAIADIEYIARQSYIVVESYRNEEEKANLLYWQLTCESFFRPEEWEWIYRQCVYTGDYSFIYFD